MDWSQINPFGPEHQLPPSIAALNLLGTQYAPFVTSAPPSLRTGLEGLPFAHMANQGVAGLLVQMFGTSLTQRAMGAAGLVPTGLGHDQNIYDMLRAVQYTRMRQNLGMFTVDADRRNFMQTLRGLANLSGTPMGAEQYRAMYSLGHAFAAVAPTLAMTMPDFYSQLAGPRGSALILAQHLAQGGRYRIDPVSGNLGYSMETAGETANMIYRALLDPRRPNQLFGLNAGQAGELFLQLQNRGLIVGGNRYDDIRRALQELGDSERQRLSRAVPLKADLTRPETLDLETLDRLSSDVQVASRLRSFNADRIQRTLREYSRVVSAMRDIFGDVGRPNAPMTELIQGLEAMTGGSLATVDAGRLATIVRTTYNLAKITGVPLENALALNQQGMTRAQQLGMENILGVQAAQGSLAFTQALTNTGAAARPIWGAASPDRLREIDVNLRVQAAGSEAANRLALVMRLEQLHGGFQEDSDLARLAQAVRQRRTFWVDQQGRSRSVVLGQEELMNLLQTGRTAQGQPLQLSQNDVMTLLHQTTEQQRFVSELDLGNLIRAQQGERQVFPFLAASVQGFMAQRMRQHLEAGQADPRFIAQTGSVAAAVMPRVIERLFSLDPTTFQDDDRRREALADILEQELANVGQDALLGGDAEQRRRFFHTTAEMMIGELNRSLRLSNLPAQHVADIYRLYNPQVRQQEETARLQADFQTRLQEALAPLGRGTALARLVEAIQSTDIEDPNAIWRLIGQSLGGTPSREIRQSLMRPLMELARQQRELLRAQQGLAQISNPEERARHLREMENRLQDIQRQARTLEQLSETFGLNRVSLDQETLRRTSQAAQSVLQFIDDLESARLGEGFITESEIEQVVQQPGTIDATDAAAILLARRQRAIELLSQHKEVVQDPMELGIDKETAQQYLNAVESLRSSVGPGLLHQTVVARMREHIRDFESPGSQEQLARIMQNPDALTREEAVALIRTRRARVSLTPSREFLDAVRQRYPQLSPAQVNELAVAELQAMRSGLTQEELASGLRVVSADALLNEIAQDRPDLADAVALYRRWQQRLRTVDESRGVFEDAAGRFTLSAEDQQRIESELRLRQDNLAEDFDRQGPFRAAAIREAMRQRSRNLWNVTQSDREAMLQQLGGSLDAARLPAGTLRRISEAGLSLQRPEDHPRILDYLVRRERLQQIRNRLQHFWTTPEGERHRFDVEWLMDEMSQLREHILTNPALSAQLGTQGVQSVRELDDIREQLRTLAVSYADNNMARLLAGDLDIDINSPDAYRTYQSTVDQARTLFMRAQQIITRLRNEGEPADLSRSWGRGDFQQAAGDVLNEYVRSGRITEDERQDILNRLPTPRQLEAINRLRGEAFDTKQALALLNLPTDLNLEDADVYTRARVAGMIYGIGSEQQAAAIVGEAVWASYSDEQRRELMDKLRSGMSWEEAARLIRPGGELQGRGEELLAQALTLGLRPSDLGPSDDVARDRPDAASILLDLPETVADEEARRKHFIMTYGMSSMAVLQRVAGVTNPIAGDLMRDILHRQEMIANQRMAADLLGLDARKTLTDEERQRLDRMTELVGIARRMTPAQEKQIQQAARSYQSLAALQALVGLSPQHLEMIAAGEGPLAGLAERFLQSRKLLTTTASQMGVPVEQLIEASSISERLIQWHQKQAQEDTLLRDIYRAYGLGNVPAQAELLTTTQKQLADLMSRPEGRDIAAATLSTRATVSRFVQAGQFDSARHLYERYRKVLQGSPQELQKFQQQLGLSMQDGRLTEAGQREWENLVRSLEFQNRAGLLDLRHETDLLSRWKQLQQYKEPVKPQGVGDAKPIPITGHLTGTFTVKGDKIDMVAAAGGSRDFAAPS